MNGSVRRFNPKELIPFLFVFLWSTGFIGAKYALPYIEPFNLLFIRMLIASCALLLLMIVFKSTWPTKAQAKDSAISGLLIHGCYLGGVFTAIKLGMPAGVSSIIVGLQPVVTALVSSQFFGAKLTRRQISGLILGFVGVSIVVLSTKNIDKDAITTSGIIACIIALIGISLGSLYQKRYGANVDLLASTFWQYIATAILMGGLTYGFESGEVVWSQTLVLALAWLVFGLSIGAVLLLLYMIREGESSKVASYFYLVPVVVCLETWVLFGEKLPLVAVFAMILTVFGVYLVVSRGSRLKEDF